MTDTPSSLGTEDRMIAVAIGACFDREGRHVIRLDEHQFSKAIEDILDTCILRGYVRKTKKGKLMLTDEGKKVWTLKRL